MIGPEAHLDLSGRVAVVTGASRGIGAAVARLLVGCGARVALLARSEEALSAVAADLGEAASTHVTDVASDDSVREAVADVVARWGRVDVLVNNAGLIEAARYDRVDVASWQQMLDVNLTGAFRLVREVVPHMSAGGRVVNITSLTAQTGGVSGGVHYSASKGGLEAFTKTLARDLAPQGITVNAVAPGQIDTDPGLLTDEQRAHVESLVPLGRLGEPEEAAAAVLFLASPMASYVTGTTIDVNGGINKR